MNPVETATYVVIFLGVGAGFVWIALGLGGLLRPQRPTPLKQATYECGELTIGPSDLQFDLRFYVVALVFLVFEVELAFFFPWAKVFGQLGRQGRGWVEGQEAAAQALPVPPLSAQSSPPGFIGPPGTSKYRPAVPSQRISPSHTWESSGPLDRRFLWLAASELGLFLAIVLGGFFYVWYQGDFDWVRALEALPTAEEVAASAFSGPTGTGHLLSAASAGKAPMQLGTSE